jgi:hypothetical protein
MSYLVMAKVEGGIFTAPGGGVNATQNTLYVSPLCCTTKQQQIYLIFLIYEAYPESKDTSHVS